MKTQNKQDGYGGCLLLIVVFVLICMFGCTKVTYVNNPRPESAIVKQYKKVFNNTAEWKYIRTELVKDFGVIMQPDLNWYLDHVKDTSTICDEPWKLYWAIN